MNWQASVAQEPRQRTPSWNIFRPRAIDQISSASELVGDLDFQSRLLGDGSLESVLIRTFIDFVQQISFLDELVVSYVKANGPSTCCAIPIKFAKTSASSVRG